MNTMMDALLKLLADPGFTAFFATYGLATVLSLYIVIVRDPRRFNGLTRNYKELEKRYSDMYDEYRNLSNSYEQLRQNLEMKYKEEYDNLCQNYSELKEAYDRLEHDLKPETRQLSPDQASKIADVGLDRDLYKLYYYIREMLDGRKDEDIEFFVNDTIQLTNRLWQKFISPFPRVPCISNLYGVYSNHGTTMRRQLESILNDEQMSTEEKRVAVWKRLVKDTQNMKREFDDFLVAHSRHREVLPYKKRMEKLSKEEEYEAMDKSFQDEEHEAAGVSETYSTHAVS
jgi:hypothetical protein